MNQRALIVGALAFALIVGGMFAYANWKKHQLASNDVVIPTPSSEEVMPERINAVHFYKDGTHTVVGDVMLPTPCDLIEASATVAESMPERVTIALDVVNNAETCAQVMTLQRFRVDFKASPEAVISVRFKGAGAILNLKEAEPGMDPEKLEDLYFKG